MEVVLGPDMALFETLILQLMSESNEQRGAAEQLFNACKTQHPDPLVLRLVHTLQSASHLDARAMSAVLLRKLITKDDVSVWSRLSPHTQSALKSQLLSCVQHEEGKSILKKLCDTVAELAAALVEDGAWPELLPFMFQCVSADLPRLQECSLLMFSQLAQYMGPQLRSHLPTLHAVFQQRLAAGVPIDVRVAALRAATSFIQTLETTAERERFQNLLPGMMQTLSLALNTNEEGGAGDVHRDRRVGAEVSAAAAGGSMMQIGTRHLAVEFLITLAERAPGMMRKLPQMISRLFATLVKLLVDVEDLPAWHAAEVEDEDAGESTNYEVGQECLDRLAISLRCRWRPAAGVHGGSGLEEAARGAHHAGADCRRLCKGDDEKSRAGGVGKNHGLWTVDVLVYV